MQDPAQLWLKPFQIPMEVPPPQDAAGPDQPCPIGEQHPWVCELCCSGRWQGVPKYPALHYMRSTDILFQGPQWNSQHEIILFLSHPSPPAPSTSPLTAEGCFSDCKQPQFNIFVLGKDADFPLVTPTGNSYFVASCKLILSTLVSTNELEVLPWSCFSGKQ